MKCCLKACALEEGFTERFLQRQSNEIFESEEGHDRSTRGHGGARIQGLVGADAEAHTFHVSVERMYASAWFDLQKQLTDHQPNEEGRGCYQMERIEIGCFYLDFVADMKDMIHLSDDEIASEST